jgi:DNA-directed RNA polymerase subunit RPC12/RpoP
MPTPTKYKCLKCTADFELLIWEPDEQEVEQRRRPVEFNRPKCKYCGSPEIVKAGVLQR